MSSYTDIEVRFADGSEIKHVGMISDGEECFLVIATDVPTKVCCECGNNVFPERHVPGYPFYCPCCDENKYEFEVQDNDHLSEEDEKDTSSNEEIEERFCLILEHATLGSMSRSNYDLETMKSVIDDAQQNHYYGVVKSDLEQLIKDGGTMEDVKDYINSLV